MIRIARQQAITEQDNVYFTNGQRVNTTEEAKYLGCWLNHRGDPAQKIKQRIAAFCSASFFDFPSEINNLVSSNLTPTLKSGLCLGPVFEISLYNGSLLNFFN